MDLCVNSFEYVKNNINSYQTSSQRKEKNSISNEARIILILRPVKRVVRHIEKQDTVVVCLIMAPKVCVLLRPPYMNAVSSVGRIIWKGFGGRYVIKGGLWGFWSPHHSKVVSFFVWFMLVVLACSLSATALATRLPSFCYVCFPLWWSCTHHLKL